MVKIQNYAWRRAFTKYICEGDYWIIFVGPQTHNYEYAIVWWSYKKNIKMDVLQAQQQ